MSNIKVIRPQKGPEETGQRGKESRRGWRHDRWNASRNISARKGGRGR